MKAFRFLVLVAAAALFLLATPGSTSAFMAWNHDSITSGALGFLKSDVLTTIASYDLAVDVRYSSLSEYHFDGCKFQESAANIDNHYQAVVTNLNPSNPDAWDAETHFGTLLHTVQDFYSHSNWVESGGTGILFDDGLSMWKALAPFTKTNGVIVIEGESYPPGYSAKRNKSAKYPGSAIVTVHTPDGDVPGLVTGAYSGDQETCPDDIQMSHNQLNKDMGYTGKRTQFRAAYATAMIQTTHEWCRLVNLVHNEYGQAGVDYLFSQWVANPSKARSVCGQ